MIMSLMTWVWIVVLFIAKAVNAWHAPLQEKGGASSKGLSVDIFGLGEGRKL